MPSDSNPMRALKITKVTVNMGIGEGGERLAKAEALLQTLTGQKPIKTMTKRTEPTWGLRKGLPIGCKVTLRREKAEKFLNRALDAVEHRLKKTSFDDYGNLSFGIKEHIDIPGVKYDPNVGIFGMDVALTIERPGYRIMRRKILKKKISKHHQVRSDEAAKFMEERYKINWEET